MAAFFANGEIKNYCRQCGRVEVDREGMACAGCRNLHRADPEPFFERMVTDFFTAVAHFVTRWWVELVVGGIAIALIVWMVKQG